MRYSVGDKVRVRKINDDMMGFSLGDIVSITEMATGKHKYRIDSKSGCIGYADDIDLEPVEEIIEYKGKKYDEVEQKNYMIGSLGKDLNEYDKVLFLKEHKEEILDEVEKRYLSTVIKPFKERIKFIIKIRRGINEEKLCYQDERDFHSFPYFKANTMYKGMELNKEYTLEELGLK